jgi:preprotein translocase subunit SecA
MLKREKVPHNVLNAKFHMGSGDRGTRWSTGHGHVSTNMAGALDIKLGERVPESGGLMVIGTERQTPHRSTIARALRAGVIRAVLAFMSVSRTT